MDHGIQNHAVVLHALDKRSHPFALDQNRIIHQFMKFLNGSVEPLDMADMKNEVFGIGQTEQFAGMFQIIGAGFLQQHVDAGIQNFHADLIVELGGNRNHRHIHLLEHFVEIFEIRNAVPLADHTATFFADI